MIFINIFVAIGISLLITLVEHVRRPIVGTLKSIVDDDCKPYLILEIDSNEAHKLHKCQQISLRVDLDSTPHN